MVKHEIARRGFLRGVVATSALLMAARSLASPAFAAALDAERQGFHTLGKRRSHLTEDRKTG